MGSIPSIERRRPAAGDLGGERQELSQGMPGFFQRRGISPLAGLLPQGGVFEAKAEADEEMPVEMRPGIPRQF